MRAYLADTAKARLMGEDGIYSRAYDEHGAENGKGRGFDSQDFLMRLAEGKTELSQIPKPGKARGPLRSRGLRSWLRRKKLPRRS